MVGERAGKSSMEVEVVNVTKKEVLRPGVVGAVTENVSR